MSRTISLSVADANQSLSGLDFSLDEVTKLAGEFYARHFNLDWKINVIMTTILPWMIIPEDGVGGKTYANDFVVLSIDPDKAAEVSVAEMLVHELAHAVRWGKNPEWSSTLFREMVSEGLAVHMEAEFAKNQPDQTFFLKTILGRSEDENRKMCEKLKPDFEAEKYDYDEIFFGNDKYPRWVGYSVGYYIVKQYLEKTGKDIFEAIGERYDRFRDAI